MVLDFFQEHYLLSISIGIFILYLFFRQLNTRVNTRDTNFQQEYEAILTSDEFKVKGKY